ncbi:Integrase catalytic domain-containing protein [Durusdinium trenchii]|uniref:Integrase catalytic domain-containing protein n=1 Tax=Durusdinium trenchii TaxID=1381693 RepID=A0ABP0L5U3_9DINO
MEEGAETPPPPPPESKEMIQEEKYWRDRPMEASKRAAPGDTLKELSAILQALGDESPRGAASVGAAQEEVEPPPPPPPVDQSVGSSAGELVPPPVEDGRGRGRSSASRRAAPGDTLREELMVMRLGADAERAHEHTLRGR